MTADGRPRTARKIPRAVRRPRSAVRGPRSALLRPPSPVPGLPSPVPRPPSPVLVLGLGNPILGDDGAGWRVVESIREQAQELGAEVDWHAGGGLSLMERLIGYDAVVLVDAAQTGRAPPGTVHTFPLETLPDPARGHLSSSHETTLGTALEVGRRIGLSLPAQVKVVAIEVRVTNEFSEELTPAVEAAMPAAGEATLRCLSSIVERLPSTADRRPVSRPPSFFTPMG